MQLPLSIDRRKKGWNYSFCRGWISQPFDKVLVRENQSSQRKRTIFFDLIQTRLRNRIVTYTPFYYGTLDLIKCMEHTGMSQYKGDTSALDEVIKEQGCISRKTVATRL